MDMLMYGRYCKYYHFADASSRYVDICCKPGNNKQPCAIVCQQCFEAKRILWYSHHAERTDVTELSRTEAADWLKTRCLKCAKAGDCSGETWSICQDKAQYLVDKFSKKEK